MPQAVIFDLDGTLLDTLADIARAMNGALRDAGLPEATEDEVRRRVGWGLTRLVRESVPPDRRDDEALVAAIAAGTRTHYRREPVVYTTPYPGVPQLLEDLAAADVPMAVLSNKPDDLVQPIVHQLLEPILAARDRRFVAVRGQREGEPRKPDPASTTEIVAGFGAPAGDVHFVGDSEVDMETARAAGCVPVGVAWGFRAPAEVHAAGAEFMCYSIVELREVLGLQVKEDAV